MAPLFFSVGDAVAFKPSPTNPSSRGIVVNMADGKVTVEWEDANRTVFDVSEALARLMPAPQFPVASTGDVHYSLPGMTEDSIARLGALGFDPVDIYSAASVLVPPSDDVGLDEDALSGAMNALGIDGSFVDGFSLGPSGMAFEPSRWFEAPLPYETRFVVDISPGKVSVVVGEAPEHILMPEFTEVPVE
jgi:hypothetical protein